MLILMYEGFGVANTASRVGGPYMMVSTGSCEEFFCSLKIIYVLFTYIFKLKIVRVFNVWRLIHLMISRKFNYSFLGVITGKIR